MKKIIFITSLALFPLAAFAISPDYSGLTSLQSLITGAIIPFLIVVATLVFIFGIIMYITAGGDEEKLKKGRNLMIFGIVALAVMIGIWGIVEFVVKTLGIGGTSIPSSLDNPF
jgi:uncharacterized membrane protein YidH (DUF202 family)